MHDFNDLVDVFIGLGNLFEDASFAIATNEDALTLEVFDDSFQITSLFRSGAAEHVPKVSSTDPDRPARTQDAVPMLPGMKTG